MAARYGSANAQCADRDGDGVSPLLGDCDDQAAGVHPGASEVANGIDDDCDRRIDDLATIEPEGGDFAGEPALRVPAQALGRIVDSSDKDRFALHVDGPRRLSVELCSRPDFQGWLTFYRPDGSTLDAQYVTDGHCNTHVYRLDAAGDWRVEVALGSASDPGSYRVRLGTAEAWPRAWGSAAGASCTADGVVVDARARSALPADSVRFWVAGSGLVGESPFTAPEASLAWTAPTDRVPGWFGLRAQPVMDGMPTASPSLPMAMLLGSSSPDSLTGGAAGEVILGLGGGDTLRGGGGADLICGGRGDDTLSGGDGDDRLNGGPGVDRCAGGPGVDTHTACE
jgi:hypothetical protein